MSAYTYDEIMSQIDKPDTLNGELKKIAKEIKKDHDLAMKLWASGKYYPRLLSILIMDRKELSLNRIESMVEDLLSNEQKEQNHIGDWLLANQLTKTKALKTLVLGFKDHPSPFLRRLFWYYQGRLRWTGQTPPDDTGQLVKTIAEILPREDPEVQIAINFCAGWIGVYDANYGKEILEIGKEVGLYKDMKVPKGCVPWYLPDFVQYELDRISKTSQ